MAGFSARETIERPGPRVWEFLTDWSRIDRWMAAEFASASEGPTGKGTRFVTRTRGRDQQSEVVEWEPGKRVALRSRQGGMTAVYDYRLFDRGESTEVTLDARCWGEGFLWKAAAPLIGFLMKRSDGAQLQALKRAIESA